MKKTIFFTVITALLTIGLHATTYTVNPTTPSIQGIINAASDGDIIEFPPGFVFTYNFDDFGKASVTSYVFKNVYETQRDKFKKEKCNIL